MNTARGWQSMKTWSKPPQKLRTRVCLSQPLWFLCSPASEMTVRVWENPDETGSLQANGLHFQLLLLPSLCGESRTAVHGQGQTHLTSELLC